MNPFFRERQMYEKQITEVSQELESMRLAVLELLKQNEQLPESERIDRHEFELVMAKVVKAGWDQCDQMTGLCFMFWPFTSIKI